MKMLTVAKSYRRSTKRKNYQTQKKQKQKQNGRNEM